MPIQTAYPFTHDPLLLGMASTPEPCQKATGYADAAISFGVGLIYDGEISDGRQKVAVPAATFTIRDFAGIAEYSHKQQRGEDAGLTDLTTTQTAEYSAGDDITIAQKRRLIVFSEQAVNPGAAVFLRHTAGGAGTAPGQFRTDADTANAIDISSVARWKSVTAGAGNAELEINLP